MTAGGADRILQAARVEVVDSQGRVRLVLGDVGNPARPGEVFGLAVVDADGRHRAWLALDDSGAALVFDRTGNAVLELGVDDGGGESTVNGAFVRLSDIDGRPVLGWRVDDEGATATLTAGRD